MTNSNKRKKRSSDKSGKTMRRFTITSTLPLKTFITSTLYQMVTERKHSDGERSMGRSKLRCTIINSRNKWIKNSIFHTTNTDSTT